MKIQLMIEVEGTSSMDEPTLQERERRWLKLLGLEPYLKNLIQSAIDKDDKINFDLRVIAAEKKG